MKKIISIILSIAMIISAFGGVGIIARADDQTADVYVSSNTEYTDYVFKYYLELNGNPYSPSIVDKNNKEISCKDGYFDMKGDNIALIKFDTAGSYTIKRMAATVGDTDLPEMEQSGTINTQYIKTVDGVISFITQDEYNAQTNNGADLASSHYINEKGEICDSNTIAKCPYYPAGTVLNEAVDDSYYDTAKATVIPVKYKISTTHSTIKGQYTSGDRHLYSGKISVSTLKPGYITKITGVEEYAQSLGSLRLEAAQHEANTAITRYIGSLNSDINEVLSTEGTVGRSKTIQSIIPEASSLISTDGTKEDTVDVDYCIYERLVKSEVLYSTNLQANKTKLQFVDNSSATLLKLGTNKFSVNEQGTDYFFTPSESGIYTFDFNADKEADADIMLGDDWVKESIYDNKNNDLSFMIAANLEKGKKYTVSVSSYEDVSKIDLTITKGHPYNYASVRFDVDHAFVFNEKSNSVYDSDKNEYYYSTDNLFVDGDKMIITMVDGSEKTFTYSKSMDEFVSGSDVIDWRNIDFYDDQQAHPWTEVGVYPITISVLLLNFDTNICLKKVTHINHNYTPSTTSPTCTEDGYTTHKCDECGASYVTDYVPAGHTPKEAVVENQVDPACDKQGTYDSVVYCSVCTKEISREQKTIQTIPHTEVTDDAVAPSCTETGLTEGKHCSVCNTVLVPQTVVNANGHTTKTTVTKATTTKNGSKVTKCTVCGTQTAKSTIYYPKTITISSSKYTYDGKAKKPTVTVKDSNGKAVSSTNYTVTYSNNTNPGKATAKVTFKGNYSGTVSKTFTIIPKGTSLKTLSATKGGFKATWTKQATQTTGYQIQIATNSGFTKGAKTYTVSSASATSKAISSLTKGKKYYVRIRTYKTVSGTKYYSSWSGYKTVTTKK